LEMSNKTPSSRWQVARRICANPG